MGKSQKKHEMESKEEESKWKMEEDRKSPTEGEHELRVRMQVGRRNFGSQTGFINRGRSYHIFVFLK